MLKNLVASFPEAEVQQRADAKQIFKDLKEKVLRDEILEHGKRLDGRKFDEIRPIWSEVGVLPRVHGSAVFTRGETQALVTCTLGTADDQQKIETRRRRDLQALHAALQLPAVLGRGGGSSCAARAGAKIGHGALAERALAPMMPTEEQFPYTVRIVSDILESNGSSSMASVCGGSLAMMDAGVPLEAPVAGMAMGLVMNEENGKFAVLTDIAGAEDHYGDMDFKVAGTRQGHHRPADGHQGRRHHHGDHAPGARAGPPGPAAHPRQDGRDAGGAARGHLAATRRASSRSRSRSTRSATSSDRAAR